ncbi:class I SAM-dependent methyltransferase [Galbibacter mesophilus]|uniref:class I SAM-dependent methyltransferase n=1 Tax=Galbibacter mesophilus TaxID=379069 RepID=UPI00191CFFA5|nr:class I SAM-dependent methyltransferase [Galbibacter mesophilus]MCM5662196.1 class I SAM-dependent methyltransferase [Galbibacter mesophilus]
MKLNNTTFSENLSQVYDSCTTQEYYNMFPNSILFYAQQEINIKGSKVFDIGCGNGNLSAAMGILGASYVLGLDISESQIEIAKAKHPYRNIEFVVDDAYTVKQQPYGPFDLVTCMYSFHFIPNVDVLKAAFQNIYKNLKEGGTLVFLDITHDYKYSKAKMEQLKSLTSYCYKPNVAEGEIPKLWDLVPGYVTLPNKQLLVDHFAIHGEQLKETMLEIGFRSVERKPFVFHDLKMVDFFGPDGFNHHLFVVKK